MDTDRGGHKKCSNFKGFLSPAGTKQTVRNNNEVSVLRGGRPSYAAGVRIAGFDCILGFFRPVSNVLLEPC